VPGTDSPDPSHSLDYGHTTSHPLARPKQASTQLGRILCWSNSVGTPRAPPPAREQLSAPSSCQSLHSLWLEKSAFQAGHFNADTVQAQTGAHAARTDSLFKAGLKRHDDVFAPGALEEKQPT